MRCSEMKKTAVSQSHYKLKLHDVIFRFYYEQNVPENNQEPESPGAFSFSKLRQTSAVEVKLNTAGVPYLESTRHREITEHYHYTETQCAVVMCCYCQKT